MSRVCTNRPGIARLVWFVKEQLTSRLCPGTSQQSKKLLPNPLELFQPIHGDTRRMPTMSITFKSTQALVIPALTAILKHCHVHVLVECQAKSARKGALRKPWTPWTPRPFRHARPSPYARIRKNQGRVEEEKKKDYFPGRCSFSNPPNSRSLLLKRPGNR